MSNQGLEAAVLSELHRLAALTTHIDACQLQPLLRFTGSQAVLKGF